LASRWFTRLLTSQESLNVQNYIANVAVNSSGTNSVVDFAENYFERFCMALCEIIRRMLWSLESISHPDRVLGPGLLESTYEHCLAHELGQEGIDFKLQHPLPVQCKGIQLDCGYRVDVLVHGQLILELKSVDAILGIHQAQLLTYMKLAAIKTGLLINFNVTKLKDGIKRFVL